jgi:PAS domain S-box-containing protein
LSKSWSSWSPEGSAVFTNIPPGNYVFMVKTKDYSGKEFIHTLNYTIQIQAPFWNTLWFKFLLFSVIAVAIITYVLNYSSRLRTSNRILESRVKKRTEELEKQKDQFEYLSHALKETSNGVLIADENGHIQWINQGLSQLIGYTLEEILEKFGKTISEVSSSPDAPNITESFKKKRQIAFRYETENTHKDGHKVFMNASITPIYDEHGTLKKMIGIYSDISDIKKKEQILKNQNKDITDNIIYAKSIQESILPNKNILFQTKPDAFIVHMPKDIVSGDFYWFKKINDVFIFALADCTGHGVHSAFLSMIGNEYLHQILHHERFPKPNQVLKELDQKIKDVFNSNEDIKNIHDGMDIALCYLDLKTKSLHFSGANRNLYIIRNHELIEIKGTKCAIGDEKEKMFDLHQQQLEQGDLLYLFSDGYQDQFGGPKNKKITLNRLKKLLMTVHSLPMLDQKNVITKNFNFWKGAQEQIDDVLMIGIRI